MENPDVLDREARAIARKSKGAKAAWEGLIVWASKKGPLAMRMAVTAFMASYGTKPEAAAVIPTVLRDAGRSITPSEKGALIRLSPHPHEAVGAARGAGPGLRTSLPLEKDRPSLSLSLHPIKGPYSPGSIHPFSSDHAAMRDVHLRMRESTRLSLGAPPRVEHGPAFDPSKSPGAFMGAQKGEHLLRSLIHKVRSHASPKKAAEAASQAGPESKAPKAARKARRAPAKKAKAPRKKAKPARKAAKPKKAIKPKRRLKPAKKKRSR
jgi:hypothetical protein